MPQPAKEEIDLKKADLATQITELHFARHPELDQKYGPIGRVKCNEDAKYHLSYLAEAVGTAQPELFADYILWAKHMLQGRGVPAFDLVENLKVMREITGRQLSDHASALAIRCIDAGLQQLVVAGADEKAVTPADEKIDHPTVGEPELPCLITQDNPLRELASEYLTALLRGDRQSASAMILRAVESGTSVKDLYLHVFQASQYEVGRLWQINQLSVAQEHYCTAATQLIMSQLYPHIFSTEKNGQRMVATCVSGDLHEIGIRMISDFFEMEGWDTFYLGANTPTDAIIRAIKERKAELLAISATMTFHINTVRRLIAAVRTDPQIRDTTILVGGYPFNIAPSLWQQLGADGHATNAEQALEMARTLTARSRS